MRVLILGSTGLLGGKIFEHFSKSYTAFGTYFKYFEKANYYSNVFHLDVRDNDKVKDLIDDLRPDVVIYAASITRPDVCEQNQELALDVNFKGASFTSDVCFSKGIKFLYISSDNVFSGAQSQYYESSKKDPVNYLGFSKSKAEDYILSNNPGALIIRPSMVYGYSPFTQSRGLLNNLLENLEKNEIYSADNITKRSPVLSDDVTKAIELLLKSDQSGIFHLSSDDLLSKYEFSTMACDLFSINSELLKIENEKQLDLPAKRPATVRLDCAKIKSLGFKFHTTKEGLLIHLRQMGCAFRLIYSTRSDIPVMGQNSGSFRIKLGQSLALEHPAPENADIIVPIPESGLFASSGYSEVTKLPIYFGIVRDDATEKTLYSKNLEIRRAKLKKKLLIVPEVVKGKSIVLMDEAIISGTTVKYVVDELWKAGVKAIHIRIPSPIMANSCIGLILPENGSRIYSSFIDEKYPEKSVETYLAEYFNVNSVQFLSYEAFSNIALAKNRMCYACFK